MGAHLCKEVLIVDSLVLTGWDLLVMHLNVACRNCRCRQRIECRELPAVREPLTYFEWQTVLEYSWFRCFKRGQGLVQILSY